MRSTMGLMVAGALLLVAGCNQTKKTDGGPASSGTTATSGTTGAATTAAAPSAAPSASAAAAAVNLPAYAEKTVAAGEANEVWTRAFKIARSAGDEGLDFGAASNRCRTQGRDLCTESQWLRACAEDPELGKLESWTLTAEGAAAVVRGGELGCLMRKVAAPSETSPARVGVCCERAVGIQTENRNDAFLISSSQRLLDYEVAARKKDVAKLGELLDETVIFSGSEVKRDELIGKLKAQDAAMWTAFDRCKVSIDKESGDSRLVSECQLTMLTGGLVASTVTVVHGGDQSRIQLMGDAESMKLLGKEKKERVRSFIGE